MDNTDIIDPETVAAYIRWSTDDQSDGTTLEVQRESCMHYIKAQGWEYRDELCFIDDGYSGGTLDRPAMTKLRREVAEGRVSCVVVYKLDRLSRSVLDTVNLVLEEWDGRCHVKSTREPIDTTTAVGKMFFYMLVSYAEWERSVIRERTLSGKKKRAEQGKNPGIKFPYGLARGQNPGDWVIVEDQAAVVRRIFRDYVGGKGLLTIANDLNKEGVPSKFGTPWRASTILYMLKNEAYKGVLNYGTRVETKDRNTGKRKVVNLSEPRHARVDGALPVIVEPELWAAAQEVHQSRELASKRSLSGAYLLSGIAKCRCGAPLVGAVIDGKYRLYSCTARRNLGKSVCNAAFINADDVETEVVATIKARYASSEEDGYIASVVQDLDEKRALIGGSLVNWRKKQEDIQRRLHRLHRDYDAGEITGRLYNTRVEESEKDLAEVQAETDRLLQTVNELEERSASLTAVRREFQSISERVDGWASLTIEEQKQVLRHAVESLTLWCTGKQRDPEDRRRVRQVVEVDLVIRKPSLEPVDRPVQMDN